MMSRFASFFGGRGDEEDEDAEQQQQHQQPAPPPPPPPVPMPSSSPPKHQSSSTSSNSSSSTKNRPRSSSTSKRKASSTKSSSSMGGISPSSAKALGKLEEYAQEVQRIEKEADSIAAALSDYPRTPRARLLECKDQIAQMNGNLEKLQYGGVDSIITAELDTGKELAKEKRKALNQRCDALRERILGHSNDLNKMLAATASKK